MNLYDGGNQGMIGLFFEAVNFIENAISNGGKVYVHCVQGISRSSSFVLSYLIWKEKINLYGRIAIAVGIAAILLLKL